MSKENDILLAIRLLFILWPIIEKFLQSLTKPEEIDKAEEHIAQAFGVSQQVIDTAKQLAMIPGFSKFIT